MRNRAFDRRPSTFDSSEAGLTLVEVVLAALVLTLALGGALLAMGSSMKHLSRTKDVELARLACERAYENLMAVKFRGADAGDASEWLFRGTYEIARNADGTAFLMPDIRTVSTTTDDGQAGAVVVEFPVPPLEPIAGRTHAGKLVFYVNESAQPVSIPASGFRFGPSVGAAFLDLNGNGTKGAADDLDVRTGHDLATSPCRMVPVKAAVDWQSEYGNERYEQFYLLCYQGFE